MAITDSLRDLDLRHLWRPYTDINVFETAPYTCFERGEGCYLRRRRQCRVAPPFAFALPNSGLRRGGCSQAWGQE